MSSPPRRQSSRALIIGIGNLDRRDDGAGIRVARRLKAARPTRTRIVEASGDSATLIETWQGAENVILIDAVHSGATPGTIHRWDARAQPIASRFFQYSTHGFGLIEAIELARVLGQLPPRLIVYGIEGKEFGMGEGLSLEVSAAVGNVAEKLGAEKR